MTGMAAHARFNLYFSIPAPELVLLLFLSPWTGPGWLSCSSRWELVLFHRWDTLAGLLSGKERVKRGGHRWAVVPAHRQLNWKGSSKIPFSFPGAAAHPHPFGCKAGVCTCGLLLLPGRKGPEMG